jgi:hypothetical protein
MQTLFSLRFLRGTFARRAVAYVLAIAVVWAAGAAARKPAT